MEKTLYSPDPQRIGELKDREGTELFRDLLWCDAARLGLRNIVISLSTTDADGGIDAKADLAAPPESPAQNGSFHFQIKTGKSFKPWRDSDVRKELFGSSTVTSAKTRLGQAVRDCLDSGGTYVLVTLGHDLSPRNHASAENLLRQYFQACGYRKAQVIVWGQGQLVKMLERYPSLCLDLGDRGNSGIQTLKSWGCNSDMTPTLVLGEAQLKFETELRNLVRGTATQHMRVIGEPGIGKTRLVLEALRSEPDLAARCLYVSQAGAFQNSKLFNELLKVDREYWVLLVIDECDETDRASIWGVLKGRERVKLITIDHGPERSADDAMRTLQFPALEQAEIESILSSHVGHSNDLFNWAAWCEGSARVAHAVGENLKRNPDDLLKPPATVPIWDRFILGYSRREGPEAERLRVIMRHIALFQKLGFKKPVADEARFVAVMAASVDPSITPAQFTSDAMKYSGRRVLQGSHTLRIVPKALHVHLWKEWWENYGATADIASMMNNMPSALQKWFLNMFIYANGVAPAQLAIREVLALANGPFSDKRFLTSDSGTQFVNTLAEADPAATIELLQATIGRWSAAEVDEWQTGRQNIVFALSKIAVWKEHFIAAAELLGRMSLGEKSTNSNNARGTLLQLFQFRHGPTQAAPSARLQLARMWLKNSDHRLRELGLQVCGSSLNLHGMSRIVGVEYQGLKPVIAFWQPTIWNDLFVPWREALSILAYENKTTEPSWKLTTSREIIQRADAMLTFNCLPDEALDLLYSLVGNSGNDLEKLVQTVVMRVRYARDALSEELFSRLKQLEKLLEGGSFLDRLKRFVVYNIYDDNYTDGKAGELAESDLPESRMAALAEELLTTPGLLDHNLAYLLQSDGYRVDRFGRHFALTAKDDRLDKSLLILANNLGALTTPHFLGGFLRGTRDLNHARWERLALKLLNGAGKYKWKAWAVIFSGFSTSIVTKLLSLYRQGLIDSTHLQSVAWPQGVRDITHHEVAVILEALLEQPDKTSARVALEIANRRFCVDATPSADPEELLLRVLTEKQLLAEGLDTMGEYYWTSLAKRFRLHFPTRDLELMAAVVTGATSPQIRSAHSISHIASDICRAAPNKAWQIIVKELTRSSKNGWAFRHWLGDTRPSQTPVSPIIEHFDPKDVMRWIKGSPRSRLRLALDFLPKTLAAGRAGDLTRAIIEHYGSSDTVVGSLAAYFDSGAHWGPRSEHMSRRREEARSWLAVNPSAAVQRWIERYIEDLNKGIEAAQIAEERAF